MRLIWLLPSAFITQMSPSRVKEIRVPSGDHVGSKLHDVRCVGQIGETGPIGVDNPDVVFATKVLVEDDLTVGAMSARAGAIGKARMRSNSGNSRFTAGPSFDLECGSLLIRKCPISQFSDQGRKALLGGNSQNLSNWYFAVHER